MVSRLLIRFSHMGRGERLAAGQERSGACFFGDYGIMARGYAGAIHFIRKSDNERRYDNRHGRRGAGT